MKTVTLNILKEDVLLNNYINGRDCAVARAAKRAGLLNPIEGGARISFGEELDRKHAKVPYPAYSRVLGMYAHLDSGRSSLRWNLNEDCKAEVQEPADFSFDITIEEE